MPDRYLAPSWFTHQIFNRLFGRLTKLGLSVRGSRILRVRGRQSGEIRTNVVNVLTHDNERYLVAPRGTTHWVRNLRVAGKAELKVGRRVETERNARRPLTQSRDEAAVDAGERPVVAGLECVGPLKVVDTVATTRLDISSGSLALPSGHGLGIELDESKLEKYRF